MTHQSNPAANEKTHFWKTSSYHHSRPYYGTVLCRLVGSLLVSEFAGYHYKTSSPTKNQHLERFMWGQYKSTTFNLADRNVECKVNPKKTCFDGRVAKFFWESNNVATSQTRRVDKIETTKNNLQLTSQKKSITEFWFSEDWFRGLQRNDPS